MKRLLIFTLTFMLMVLAGCSKEPTPDLGNVSMVGTRWRCLEEGLEMTFVSDTKVMVDYEYDGGGVGEYKKNGGNITFINFHVVTYMIEKYESGVLSSDGRTLTVRSTHTPYGETTPIIETYTFTKR